MSDRTKNVVCTGCGLEYSVGEKRCPLCGVKNRNVDIFSALFKKKNDDSYDRYSSYSDTSQRTNAKPNKRIPVKADAGRTVSKSDRKNKNTKKTTVEADVFKLILVLIMWLLISLLDI